MVTRASDVLGEAGREFVLTWPRLLAADLLYKLVAFMLLAPLSALALRAFVATSGGAVLADQDILLFVLSPVGLTALVVLAGLALAVLALEQACLMTLAFGAVHDARVSVLHALAHGLRNAVGILRVAVRVVATTLAIAAPFLAVAGFAGLRLLTEFDINFYLTDRPPAFWTMVGVVLVLGTGLAAILVPRLAGWTYALPILLFEDATPGQALDRSLQRARGHRWRIAMVFAGWLAANAVAAAVLLGSVAWIGRVLVGAPLGVGLLVVTLGLLFLVYGGANLLLTFFQAAGFAVLVVGLYRDTPSHPSPRVLEMLAAPDAPRLRWTPSAPALWGGLAMLTVLAAGTGMVLLRSVRTDDDVRIIAHRGASAAAPENTLAAVARALDDGTDMVEIDVQETADGHVVVAHDADLMKLARTPLNIWDATLDELTSIDIGSWFGPEFADQRVPTLRQVLELSRGRAEVNIELKYYGHDERLEERVVEVVEELDMAGEVVVMSLEYDAVRKMRTLRPDWQLGLLSATAVGDLTTVDADFLAVNTAIATRRFIRSAHARDKLVYVWTVNDPLVMWQLINLGVDGLITDEPGLAREVLQYRADLSSVERLLFSAAILLGERPVPSTEGEA